MRTISLAIAFTSLFIAGCPGGGGGGAAAPAPVNITACQTPTAVEGAPANHSDSDTAGLIDDWVQVRADLADSVRATAEVKALPLLDAEIARVTCPANCPNAVPIGQPAYDTTGTLSVAERTILPGLVYTYAATSTASQNVQCLTDQQAEDAAEEEASESGN